MVEALKPLGFQVLQHLLLVKERLNIKTGSCIRRRCATAAVPFQCGVQLFAVAVWIVALEGSLLPVAVKRDLELPKEGGHGDRAKPDVPFQPVQQPGSGSSYQRMRCRNLCSGGRATLWRAALWPGFVADLDFGPIPVYELVNGAAFRGAHIGGGDDPQLDPA